MRVTERTIISVEKGKYKPSIVLAYKLAKLFGTDIETLFCLKEFGENEGDCKIVCVRMNDSLN